MLIIFEHKDVVTGVDVTNIYTQLFLATTFFGKWQFANDD